MNTQCLAVTVAIHFAAYSPPIVSTRSRGVHRAVRRHTLTVIREKVLSRTWRRCDTRTNLRNIIRIIRACPPDLSTRTGQARPKPAGNPTRKAFVDTRHVRETVGKPTQIPAVFLKVYSHGPKKLTQKAARSEDFLAWVRRDVTLRNSGRKPVIRAREGNEVRIDRLTCLPDNPTPYVVEKIGAIHRDRTGD